MFKHLQNINSINKVISLIITTILSIVIKNIYLLIILTLLLLILSIICKSNKIFLLSIFTIFLLCFIKLDLINYIYRCFLIIDSILIFFKLLKIKERSFLFNKISYLFNKKVERWSFKKCYYEKLLKRNKEKIRNLRSEPSILDDNLDMLNDDTLVNTKEDMDELYIYYKIRYYKYYKNRTNHLILKWYKEDTMYLILLSCLFLLSILL